MSHSELFPRPSPHREEVLGCEENLLYCFQHLRRDRSSERKTELSHQRQEGTNIMQQKKSFHLALISASVPWCRQQAKLASGSQVATHLSQEETDINMSILYLG